MSRRVIVLGFLVLGPLLLSSPSSHGDEADLFSAAGKTDLLVILDLSGSMNWSIDGTQRDCSDPTINPCPYYLTRHAIAKEAIRQVLDDDEDGEISSADEARLGVRIGYLRFTDCTKDIYSDYVSPCVALKNAIGSSYSNIWDSIRSESANRSTALAASLHQAKIALDAHKSTDPWAACAQKFAVLITGGEDTLACGGSGLDTDSKMYKRRKATVSKAKFLADAGYKVIVVGFGATMPAHQIHTLNWTAYFGGTDNPGEPNTGDPRAIVLPADPCADDPSNDPGSAGLTGYAYIATSADQLRANLKQVFRVIRGLRVSFVPPSVPPARLAGDDYILAASFIPQSGDPLWKGSLKRYGIRSDGKISAGEDWDAGELLKSRPAGSRNLYTYKDTGRVAFNTGFITPEDVGLEPGNFLLRDAIVGTIRGEPAYNPDSWKLGDVFHSNPVKIGGPSIFFNDPGSPEAFKSFRERQKDRDRLVLVGANDGQVHAFRASDGYEKWSMIPPNLLPKIRFLAHSLHPAAIPHQFYVDGPISAADVWLGTGDGTGKVATDWKTLAVVGLGRGVRDSENKTPAFLWSSSPSCSKGFNPQYTLEYPYYCGYYAFDVTDTSSNLPMLKWRLTPDAGQSAYLAEPWSMMRLGKILYMGNEKWVGFIGGGYQHDHDPGDDHPGKGRGFFVVDLSNGGILWSFNRGVSSKMAYSIPGSPAMVDTDHDGFVDTVYLGDLGGNLWRLTFCTARAEREARKLGKHCGPSDWGGGLLFESTPGFQRPIFTAPTVARDATSMIWVLWGTGDQMDPMNRLSSDRFFAVKDSGPDGAYNITDLQDVTAASYSSAKPGWYINLTGLGEKVLAEPSVFGGMAAFTTFTPPPDAGYCGREGTAKLYAMALMPITIDGITYDPGAGVLSKPASPASTAGGDRSVSLGAGIPSSPVFSQPPAGGGIPTRRPTDLMISLSGGLDKSTSLITSASLPDYPFKERLRHTTSHGHLIHWRNRRNE
jgi:outer membrane protein assembly factor BamB